MFLSRFFCCDIWPVLIPMYFTTSLLRPCVWVLLPPALLHLRGNFRHLNHSDPSASHEFSYSRISSFFFFLFFFAQLLSACFFPFTYFRELLLPSEGLKERYLTVFGVPPLFPNLSHQILLFVLRRWLFLPLFSDINPFVRVFLQFPVSA